jgi:predicted DNA-binding transcriptional regulator AlpA
MKTLPDTGRRLHLDRRVEAIIAATGEGSDDDLLTTLQVANWLGTSPQWVELGRAKGYGPPFMRIAPQVVRYKRSAILAWLKDREFTRTSEYRADRARRKKRAAIAQCDDQ